MHIQPTPLAHPDFIQEHDERIKSFASDDEFIRVSKLWRSMALERKYMNNFSWLGRPSIQFPGDVMAVQELISAIRPTLVIETGIAHGGSLILSASLMKMNNINGRVIGVDIDIRDHNRTAITNHSCSDIITLYQGSSVDPTIVSAIRDSISTTDTVMVFLDSNHTHEHVLAELNAYAGLVSKGSYLVVFDTHVEDMPDSFTWSDRPWGKGNNPKTAVHQWLPDNPSFIIDKDLEHKILLTSAPDGFLYNQP